MSKKLKLLSKKEAQEQSVFRCFLKIQNLPTDDELYESAEPPAPDILYKTCAGHVAFELMEICSPDIAAVKFYDGVSKFIRPHDTYRKKFKDKLRKNYVTEYPIELLLYTVGRTVSPDDLIIENLKSIIESQECKFCKIWLLGDELHLLHNK